MTPINIYHAGRKLYAVGCIEALLNARSYLCKIGYRNVSTDLDGQYVLIKPHGKAVNRHFTTYRSASKLGIDLYGQNNHTIQFIASF